MPVSAALRAFTHTIFGTELSDERALGGSGGAGTRAATSIKPSYLNSLKADVRNKRKTERALELIFLARFIALCKAETIAEIIFRKILAALHESITFGGLRAFSTRDTSS